MAGILNNKSRVIDAILTVEGRRRMAEGSYSIAYATFTDEGVSYKKDPANGHEDPTGKIYLEARNLPQDQITFIANDDGKIIPFRAQDIKVTNATGIVPASTTAANIVNGRLEINQYMHGYSIKFSDILESESDTEKGFIYSDDKGVTGSILIKNSLPAGTFEITGSPHPIGRVGTRGGYGANGFASTVSRAIIELSASAGPKVIPNVQFDTLYINPAVGSLTSSRLESIGTLSSPLVFTEPAIGGVLLSGEIDSPSFASQIDGILTSSFDNFGKQYILSSIDRLFLDDSFSLSRNEITFNIDRISSQTLNVLKTVTPSVSGIDSLFQDRKFSHLDNFLYLPPIVKVSDSQVPDKSNLKNTQQYLLGDYPSWGNNEERITLLDIQKEISQYDTTAQPIVIDNSSNKNNIIGQFFEISNDTVSKLDVVDCGVLDKKHVYFVGKTFLDNRGTATFVNIFTLIFSQTDGEKDILQ